LEVILNKWEILQAKLRPLFIRAEGWSTASCLFLAAFFVQWYVSSASFALKSFSGRTIGIVVLQAVDAAERTNTYVLAILLFTILFFVFLLLHNIFRKWLDQMPDKPELKNYQNLVFDISALGLFNIWWGIIQQSKQAAYSSYLILAIMLAAYLLLIDRRLFSGSTFVRQLEQHSYSILIALLIPVSIILACRVILGRSLIITPSVVVTYMGIAGILLAAYGLFIQWCLVKRQEPGRMLSALTVASIPLLLVPCSIPFSNELQYTLSNIIFSGRTVAGGVFTVLLLGSAALFFLTYRKGNGDRHITAILNNIVLPILVGTVTLYVYYTPQINQRGFDVFHDGENLITVQQMFQFGAIPFVDIFPTHGFSAAYSQVLYSLFNGYSFVEPWLWNWMNGLVSLLLFFFLFKTLLGPLKAFLVTMFLPVDIIFPDYYITAVLPLLVCAWTFSSNNTRTGWKKYLALWVVSTLMFLWRIDFGLACMVAVIAIYVLLQAHKLFNRQLETSDIVSFVMTGGLVLLSAFLLLAGLCRYHAQPVGEVLAQVLRFLTYQGPVQAFQVLYNQFSVLVLIQYVLIPCTSLGCVIIFCQLMARKDKIHSEQIILIFTAIFFLIMSVRSTQRHSLIEGFNPFGFVFLISLLFLMFRPNAKQAAFGIFLFVLGVITPLPPKQAVLVDRLKILVADGSKLKQGLLSKEFFSFQNWKNKKRRAIIGDAQYKDIVLFLNQNLLPGQTFYEFVNHPLLYVAANKEMPAYFIPILYNASDLIQNVQVKRLQKFWEGDRLPFVVFKSNTHWDAKDDVPNEVRCYRIVEFIYDHYRPLGKVGRYQVWVDKRKPLSYDAAMVQGASLASLAPLMKFRTDMLKSNNLKVLSANENTISIQAGADDPYFFQFIDSPPGGFPIDSSKQGWFLSLRYSSSVPGDLQVFTLAGDMLQYTEEFSTHADIKATSQSVYVIIPIKIPEGARRIMDVRLDPPNNAAFTLEEVRLFRSSSLLPEAKISQSFDLKKLPYIWGQYDEKHAAHATRELQQLMTKKELNVQPKQRVVLPLQSDYDKSTGSYLHFRISASEEAQVTVTYNDIGDDFNSSITFDVVRSWLALDYLVRMSTQWVWVAKPINKVVITTTAPITIEQVCLRKGD
jgi:hypothetical protein